MDPVEKFFWIITLLSLFGLDFIQRDQINKLEKDIKTIQQSENCR